MGRQDDLEVHRAKENEGGKLISMKHLRYLVYVLRHKWYVFIECAKLGIVWQGIIHDWSKFLPTEWFPYVDFFFGKYAWVRGSNQRPPKDIDDKFDLAWLHHQHCNPHHWQWWIRHGDDGSTRVFPMSPRFRMEMLADWRGAGKAQGKSDTRGFYIANKDRMTLHPETREWIEKQLVIR